MDYSVDIQDLDRHSLLVKLQLHKSKQGTSRLRQVLLHKLKSCHPIHTALKQMALIELRRIVNEIGIDTHFLKNYATNKLRQYVANFFFQKYPNTPLTNLRSICSRINITFNPYFNDNYNMRKHCDDDTISNRLNSKFNQTETNIHEEINLEHNLNFQKNTNIEKNTNLKNNTNLTNNTNLKNDTNFKNDTNIENDMIIDKDLNLDKDFSLYEDMNLDDSTNIDNNTNPFNDTNPENDTNLKNDINCCMDTSLVNDIGLENGSNLETDNNLENDIELENDIDLENDINLDENINIEKENNDKDSFADRNNFDDSNTYEDKNSRKNHVQFTGLRLRNTLGQNLCFVNSILNLLSSSVYYRESVNSKHCDCHLCKFMRHALKYPLRTYDTRGIRDWISNFNPNLNQLNENGQTYKQQDAQEFLVALFGPCKILSRLTRYSTKITMTCIICSKVSEQLNTNHMLIFPISEGNNNIASMLQRNKFSFLDKYCENCNSEKPHSTVESYESEPDILLIIVQRFETTQINNIYIETKKQDAVVPSENIVMKTELALKAVSEHSGTLTSNGHYTTTLRKSCKRLLLSKQNP